MLGELHDRLDVSCAVDRPDRRLVCKGHALHGDTLLTSQGIMPGCVVQVFWRLRGGSVHGDRGEELDAILNPEHPDEDASPSPPPSPVRRAASPFSEFLLDHSVAAPSAIRASRQVLGAPVESSVDGRLLSVVRAPDNTFGELISLGGHVQGIAPPLIDPRLLNEDSSFNHRITQRQRNPRRRDSDYVRFFGQGGGSGGPPQRAGSAPASLAHPIPSVVLPRPPTHASSVVSGEDPSVRHVGRGLLSKSMENNRLLLRKAITLPSFSGLTRDWVQWNAAVERFFEVHQLGHVLLVGYLQSIEFDFEDNKLVYFTLEMSISKSPKAKSLFQRAPRLNGNAGYLFLVDGYTLSGIAAAPLLLHRLTSFRFQPSEDVFSFVLRLTDLFDELGRLPGAAACEFTDNQKVHYLLSAIRNEKSLTFMYENLQTQQSRGTLTFDLACDDLQLRYEALKADELLTASPRQQPALVAAGLHDTSDPPSQPALLSTQQKRLNQAPVPEYSLCLADGCATREHTPLCRLHYAELVCGKTPAMVLREGLGTVTYNAKENRAIYPSTVPEARRKNQPRGPKVSAGPRKQ